MEYKHFSHHHNLTLYHSQPGQQFSCSGCEKTSPSSSYYACLECNFFLHEHCGNAKRFVKHPSHTQHPLILLPSPTYCGGTFSCNGCGEAGKALSYCCALCEVDLHVQCAFLPPKVNHANHTHELCLDYSTQQKEALVENCQLCNKPLVPKHWKYSCLSCDFHVHTFCATNKVKPGLYLDDHDDSYHATSVAQPENANHQAVTETETETESESDSESETGTGTEIETERDPAVEMLKLQLQMQLSQQIARMGQTLSNLS